jgi:hypothetical protein
MPAQSRDLADYHALLAADIQNFTGNNDAGSRRLAGQLPRVLSEAFARSGLDFFRTRFPGQAGDGYVAGIDYHKLAHLIHPLLDQLQYVLAEHNTQAKRDDPRMRLRVSVHVGHLPSEPDADDPAGNGTAMSVVHRLLNGDPVRDALRDSDPDATFVAAVISQRAFEDAVDSGMCALTPSMFAPIEVPVKQFTGNAWLYVPKPSGPVRHQAFARGADPRVAGSASNQSAAGLASTAAAAPASVPTPHITVTTAGQVAGTVTGPVTIPMTISDSRDHHKS